MNLREGTRRLALLLGLAGTLGGCFVSYLEWQDFQSQRTRHVKFEQLANSDVVKEQRKTLQSPDPFAGIAKPIPQHGRAKLSDAQPLPQIDPNTGERQGWEWPSTVDKGGIKAIRWSENYGVESIETEEGETLYQTPAPSAWLYLLIAFFPLLGFVIPSGAVRAIGWTLEGFIHPLS